MILFFGMIANYGAPMDLLLLRMGVESGIWVMGPVFSESLGSKGLILWIKVDNFYFIPLMPIFVFACPLIQHITQHMVPTLRNVTFKGPFSGRATKISNYRFAKTHPKKIGIFFCKIVIQYS